jgi:hypothetical protein
MSSLFSFYSPQIGDPGGRFSLDLAHGFKPALAQ